MKSWSGKLVPCGFGYMGQEIYTWKKIRPRWYWQYKRLCLFLSILWREWEPGYRMDWKLSWSVASGVYENELKEVGK